MVNEKYNQMAHFLNKRNTTEEKIIEQTHSNSQTLETEIAKDTTEKQKKFKFLELKVFNH